MKITPFDRGIEEVLWENKAPPERSPERFFPVPGESPVEARLPELLQAPSLEDRFLSSLAPVMGHREITVPARFGAVGEGALDRLRGILEKVESGEDREALGDLVKLLEGQRDLRELLTAYRKLLVQG